jgi:hypothetical protein
VHAPPHADVHGRFLWWKAMGRLGASSSRSARSMYSLVRTCARPIRHVAEAMGARVWGPTVAVPGTYAGARRVGVGGRCGRGGIISVLAVVAHGRLHIQRKAGQVRLRHVRWQMATVRMGTACAPPPPPHPTRAS